MNALDRNMRISFPFLKVVALRHRSKLSNAPWKRVERQGVIRSDIARPRTRLLPIQIAAERVRKIDPIDPAL